MEHRQGAWDQLWRARKRHYLYRNVLQAVAAVDDLRGGRVLEIGCGRGVTLLELARCGRDVIGVDYSSESMAVCQQLKAELKLLGSAAFVRADAFHLPFASDSFDFVYSVGLIEHFHHPARLLQEQYRVLRPGGRLLVQVPQKYSAYTVLKQLLMRVGKWPYGGWETQFTATELSKLATHCGFTPRLVYGYGSFVLAAVRHVALPDLDFAGMWRLGLKVSWIRSFKANTALDVCLLAEKESTASTSCPVEEESASLAGDFA